MKLEERGANERVKQLVQDGTIQQFTIRVRGANVRALVEVQVDTDGASGEVADQVRSLHGVEAVWELTGDWDVAVLVDAEDTAALNRVVDAIRAIEAAQATRTRVLLNEQTPYNGET